MMRQKLGAVQQRRSEQRVQRELLARRPMGGERGVKVESVLGEKTDRIDDPKLQSAGATHR